MEGELVYTPHQMEYLALFPYLTGLYSGYIVATYGLVSGGQQV